MTNLSQRSITYIDLVLKGKWYDLIESGEKTAEYRKATEFWLKRIHGGDPIDLLSALTVELAACVSDMVAGNRRAAKPICFDLKHHYVRFRRGYGKDAPTMMFYIGTTGYVCVPPAEVQAEVGSDPVIKLELLQRVF